jgi:hypothetical protein
MCLLAAGSREKTEDLPLKERQRCPLVNGETVRLILSPSLTVPFILHTA